MRKKLSLLVCLKLAIILLVSGCNIKSSRNEELNEEPAVIEEQEVEEVVEEEIVEDEEIIINEQNDDRLQIKDMSFIPPIDCDDKAMESLLNEYVLYACMLDMNGVNFNIALEDLQIDITVEEYIDLARANYDYFPNAEINYYEFNGITWANLRGELHEGVVTEQLIAIYNDTTYILTYTSPFEDYETYVDYIIDTFKTIEFY